MSASDSQPDGVANAGAPNEGGGESIPLLDQEVSRRFLMILKSVPPESAPIASTQAAVARWKLTAREMQVLDLIARGLTNSSIAETLAIRVGTVEFHLAKIFDKAGVDNRATLIARLQRPHDL